MMCIRFVPQLVLEHNCERQAEVVALLEKQGSNTSFRVVIINSFSTTIRVLSIRGEMGKKVLAFDLYGTLLSTNSIATALSEHYGPEMAESIATLWRRYQIEYTFRLNSMSK